MDSKTSHITEIDVPFSFTFRWMVKMVLAWILVNVIVAAVAGAGFLLFLAYVNTTK